LVMCLGVFQDSWHCYLNFVKRLLPVRFLYFPSLDLIKQALPVGNF
jgi:hypothetical protein